MNTAQAVDPETGRFPAEAVSSAIPRCAPWSIAEPLARIERLAGVPTFRDAGPEDVPEPRERGLRVYKSRANGAGRREVIEALRRFGEWASFKKLKELLPRVDRNRLKLRVFRAVQGGLVERRAAGTTSEFEYRVVKQ